jgi:probable rRNA maturation factor
MSVDIHIEDARWRKIRNLPSHLRMAVRRTLAAERRKGSLTVLLTGDEALQTLNRRFRRKNKPTNVLSFPASSGHQAYLGDIAIAYGVTATEAKAAKTRVTDHAVHLAVHGTLHLLGYDHVKTGEAEIMEGREIAILARLGIRNPYRQAS